MPPVGSDADGTMLQEWVRSRVGGCVDRALQPMEIAVRRVRADGFPRVITGLRRRKANTPDILAGPESRHTDVLLAGAANHYIEFYVVKWIGILPPGAERPLGCLVLDCCYLGRHCCAGKRKATSCELEELTSAYPRRHARYGNRDCFNRATCLATCCAITAVLDGAGYTLTIDLKRRPLDDCFDHGMQHRYRPSDG